MQQWKVFGSFRKRKWVKITMPLMLTIFFFQAYLKIQATKEYMLLSIRQKGMTMDFWFVNEETKDYLLNHSFASRDPEDFPYRYLINEANACGNRVDIINVIPVAADNLEARLMTRELWGNPKYRNITGMKTVFLLGTADSNEAQASIIRESEIFHDIIQMNFRDTYEHLTLKTLSLLHWVKTFCPSARWVLKSDVDIFVNAFDLSRFLKSRDEDFVCIVHPKPKVCHELSAHCPAKWVIPREVFARDFYPPYCRGPAYIIRTGIAPLLFQAANKTHPFVMEDAYFTGILAEPMSPKYFNLEGDKFSFFLRDVDKSLESLSFLLLNIENFKKREPPTLWNQVLDINGLPRQKVPGKASEKWSGGA